MSRTRKMSQQERTLFDTVQYLLMSEGRSPLSVPLSEPQKKALELRKQRERLERHVSDIRIRNAAAGRWYVRCEDCGAGEPPRR